MRSTASRRLRVVIEPFGNCPEPVCRALPSSRRRGGCAIKKISRSLRSGADGVVAERRGFGVLHHPPLCGHAAPLPSSRRRGGCAIKKKIAKPPYAERT